LYGPFSTATRNNSGRTTVEIRERVDELREMAAAGEL
jgi:hypothetical protein